MESITVTLTSGSITLQVDADFLSMDPDDFAFVAGLAQTMRARAGEGSSPAPEEEADGAGGDEPEDDEVHQCPDCGTCFTSTQALGSHRWRAHQVRGEQRKAKAPAAAGPFPCPRCGREFPTRNALGPHRRACAGKVDEALDPHRVAEIAKAAPHGTRQWQHVARTLGVSEGTARAAVIDARRAGLLPSLHETSPIGQTAPFDPDKARERAALEL